MIDNVFFPTIKLIHGLKKTLSRQVTIVSNGNSEYRLSKTANTRRYWEYPTSTMTKTDMNTLAAFWEARGGKLKGFKFIDPDDGVTYNVRFDNDIGWSLEALNSNNTPYLISYEPIRLIQVFD